MTRRDRNLTLAAGLAALLALGAGAVAIERIRGGDPFAPCRQSAVAGGLEQFGGPFALTDQTGRRVTDAEVFREPTLLYFGYTYCPDVCPADTARNAEAIDLLAASGISATPVMITVDPRRDTPPVMADFAGRLHEKMIGLTGTPEEIAAANRLWRNYYKAHDENGGDDYLVDHMTNTYLVLPGRGTVEFFGRDATAEQIAERTACFVRAAA